MQLERVGDYVLITAENGKKNIFTFKEFYDFIGQDYNYDYPKDQIKDHALMIKINGKGFRCSCGCNVFHKPRPKTEPSLIYCNACDLAYSSEEPLDNQKVV